ncbi:SPW repeat protein [Actinoallomurus oryzae]|uniref:SPW repeat protein n=2 Tax=Actinoallomurus oryzae TaxID=502180 RepID=A0ABP8R3E8_9ACTN
MAGYSRHSSGMAGHPDAAEMRERYARLVEGRRMEMLEGLVLMTGLYLAISPWVIHFHTGNMNTVNNLIIGIALAVIGLGLALVPERTRGLAWLIVPLGVWMIISPWVVSAGHGARAGIVANNVAVGFVTVALGLAAVAMMARHRRGRARAATAMR